MQNVLHACFYKIKQARVQITFIPLLDVFFFVLDFDCLGNAIRSTSDVTKAIHPTKRASICSILPS